MGLCAFSFIFLLCKSMVKDEKLRYSVAYTAVVRVTHRKSGAFKEDCGAGDSTDRSIGTAVAHAMKSAITDAMKRASRHFGEKLGNCKFHCLKILSHFVVRYH